MRKRLRLLALLSLAALATAQTLRDLAAERGIRIGAAVDPSHLNESQYDYTLSREFNQLTAENAMKFEAIHPGIRTYSFNDVDALVTYGEKNQMAVRGHTLVWQNQNPAWLTEGTFTPAERSAILEDHIRTVVGRYAGRVYAWDVVNEAFLDDGKLRSTLWSDAPGIGLTGTGYIEQAFRWARSADPRALLFYNDYNAEGSGAKSDAIFHMVEDFKKRGVPIDGVGLQMHWSTSPSTLASIEANIRRLTDLGVQVQITELDVRVPIDAAGNATAESLATQAQIYRDMVGVCLKFAGCTAIQTWGFTDKYSWIPPVFPGTGAALPWDAAYNAKPAYNAIATALRQSPPVITAAGLANAASYASRAVAPGEIIVLFGPTYGPAALAVSTPGADGKLPTKLSDTRLLFDGMAAPLIYTVLGQVSAIVPFAVAGHTTAQVEYEYRDIRSTPVTVNVTPTMPGIFTLDSSGRGAAAVLDASYRVISNSNPAARGDTVLVFATGAGVTDPAGADGALSLTAPFGKPVAAVSVQIGGEDCTVTYAAGAYGLVAGALQVNVEVSSKVRSGDQPLVLRIGNEYSQSVATIRVK